MSDIVGDAQPAPWGEDDSGIIVDNWGPPPDPAVTMTFDNLQPADEPQNTGFVPPQYQEEFSADTPGDDFGQDFATTPDDATASPDDSSNVDNP